MPNTAIMAEISEMIQVLLESERRRFASSTGLMRTTIDTGRTLRWA